MIIELIIKVQLIVYIQHIRIMEKNEFSDSQIDALRALAIGDKSTSIIGSSLHHGADNIKVMLSVWNLFFN
jgi:hypothetical protein